MGLFTKRPYDVSCLNAAEKSATRSALEVAQMLDTQGKLKKELKNALTGLRKGKMSRTELATSVACLAATLAALNSGDDPERSSLLAKQKIATVIVALALDKLKGLL